MKRPLLALTALPLLLAVSAFAGNPGATPDLDPQTIPAALAEEECAVMTPAGAPEVPGSLIETPALETPVEPVQAAECCTAQDRQFCTEDCAPCFGKTVCLFGVCDCFCATC